MAIIQGGNIPGCKHERLGAWEKSALGFIPILQTNCADCGEWIFRFPKEEETSKKEMEASFEATDNAIHGKPTD
jgi:hypothetical protein